MHVMLLFVKVEVTVEHDLSVEWSIALHMSCHQALTDVFVSLRVCYVVICEGGSDSGA